MFYRAFVCVFACLLATSRTNYRSDLHENVTIDVYLDKKLHIKFCRVHVPCSGLEYQAKFAQLVGLKSRRCSYTHYAPKMHIKCHFQMKGLKKFPDSPSLIRKRNKMTP